MCRDLTQSSSDSRNDAKALTSSIQSHGSAGNTDDVAELLPLPLPLQSSPSPDPPVRVCVTAGDDGVISRLRKRPPVHRTALGAHTAVSTAEDGSARRGSELDDAAPAVDEPELVGAAGVARMVLVAGRVAPGTGSAFRPRVLFQ
jgi:hypothetical protein